VEIGEATLTIAWKALQRREIQILKFKARAWLFDQIKREDIPKEDVDSAFLLDVLNNEVDLRIIHASMVDPNSEGGRGPALTLAKLRKNIRPGQQTRLQELWWAWQTSADYEDLTEDQIEEMIQAAQVGDRPFLLGFGAGGLVTSFISLAKEHAILKTIKSTDGGSSEPQSTDTSNELEDPLIENSLPDLLRRLSVLEVNQERNKRRIDDTRAEMDRKLRAKS
jgi:hypothetical protein